MASVPMKWAQVFLSKEGTAGSEETPAAGDILGFESVAFNDPVGAALQRQTVRAHTDTEPPISNPTRHWSVPLAHEVKAATDADGPPELDEWLQAAGFDETIVASTSATYSLADFPNQGSSGAVPTATIWGEKGPADGSFNGKRWTAIGCRIGGVTFSGGFNTRVLVSGTAVGQYKRPADITSLTSGTYDAGNVIAKLKASGNPFQFHSYDMIVRNWTISVGLEAVMRSHASARSTFAYATTAYLRRTAPVSGSITLEVVDEASFALWAAVEAATASAGSIIYSDGTRDVTFTLRNVVFGPPTVDAGPPAMYQLPFTAHRSGASGALDIVFT